MVKQISAGKKAFGKETFQRLADQSGLSLTEFIASLLRWNALYGHRVDGKAYPNSYPSKDSSDKAISAEVEEAFSFLETSYRRIREELRKLSWHNHNRNNQASRADDAQVFALIFKALSEFFDQTSVRLLKSCAVIFHRDRFDNESDYFGYGLKRHQETEEWQTPFIDSNDITEILTKEINVAWSHYSDARTWLEAKDVFPSWSPSNNYSPDKHEDCSNFFLEEKCGSAQKDKLIIQPVHEQSNPMQGVGARMNIIRTTLIFRFSYDDNVAINHVMETVASRTADIIEYVRLLRFQDVVLIRSLTDSALSLKLCTLPRQSQYLEGDAFKPQVKSILLKLRKIAEAIQVESKVNAYQTDTEVASRLDFLRELLACDVWVFDERSNNFFDHRSSEFRCTLPLARKKEVFDQLTGNKTSYETAYNNYLSALRPSGLGGKSLSCIAHRLPINVDDRSFSLLKKEVRILEQGNQVAVPIDLFQNDDNGNCRNFAHAILWARFDGKQTVAAVGQFIMWLCEEINRIDGVRIAVGESSRSFSKSLKLSTSDISRLLENGKQAVLKPLQGNSKMPSW
jgi:hypothetical protein